MASNNSSMSSSAAGSDHTVDVLVVGSGAGAMVSAITAHDGGASVLIIEKDNQYGGNSARSGGGMWIPGNHLMKADGIEDSPETVLTYMKAVIRETIGDRVEAEEVRLKTYIKKAPEMFKYICDNAGLNAQRVSGYPDYHPFKPGWSKERLVESKMFNARQLGDDYLTLHKPPFGHLMMGIMVSIKEGHDLLIRAPGWIMILLKRIIKYYLDIPWRFKSKRSRDLCLGLALIGTLRLALKKRKVPLWLSTPAREFIRENGRIVGVVAERDGKKIRIRANKGVIMASGGLEGSTPLRQKYLPTPTDANWTAGSPANTGDAIAMGQAIGAKLDYMNLACWMPVDLIPGKVGGHTIITERSIAGSMIVNKLGDRFMNEALPYINAVEGIYANQKITGKAVPCYMIFDATFRARYPMGPVIPGSPDITIPKGYLEVANTLEELAQKLGIEDAAKLKQSAAKLTDYARTGVDTDFHRGENDYDRYWNDGHYKPNVCLGPIEKPPFYGLKVYPGDLGTSGGLKTDEYSRVLTEAGEVIPGLYATGNCSAGIIAGTYPGPGCTLGPTMTYGYIAARHLTQQN